MERERLPGVRVNGSYGVGRGSASGQWSIVNDDGVVVGYADSRADAEEAAAGLNRDDERSFSRGFGDLRAFFDAKDAGFGGSWGEFQAGLSRLESGCGVGVFVGSRLDRIMGMGEVDRYVTDGIIPAWVNTPLSDPSMARYRYLLGEGWPVDTTLYDFIGKSIKAFQCYWIVDDATDEITGCLLYFQAGRSISRLKFFSVRGGRRKQNRKDFKDFVRGMVNEGFSVSWTAVKDNAIVSFYNDVIQDFSGTVSEDGTDSGVLHFAVAGAADEEGRKGFSSGNSRVGGGGTVASGFNSGKYRVLRTAGVRPVDVHGSQCGSRLEEVNGPGGVGAGDGAFGKHSGGDGNEWVRAGSRFRQVVRVKPSVGRAADKFQDFLDREGAEYRHHVSRKSSSEYFDVERPGDRMSPEVNVRVSDHRLPAVYGQPDVDIDPAAPPRMGGYTEEEGEELVGDFLEGEIDNIVDGEPVVSRLVPVTGEVEGEIRKDPVLMHYLLYTPIDRLPSRFQHLVHYSGPVDFSLNDLFDFFSGDNSFVVQSEDDGSYIGYVGYHTSGDGRKVTDIKLFDFNFEGVPTREWQSHVVSRDVLGLMGKLRKEYEWVRWSGYEENKRVVNVYKVYAQRNGGVGPIHSDDGLLFLVPGTVGSLSREDVLDAIGGEAGVDVGAVLDVFSDRIKDDAEGGGVHSKRGKEQVDVDVGGTGSAGEVLSGCFISRGGCGVANGYPDLQGRGKGFIKSRLVRLTREEWVGIRSVPVLKKYLFDVPIQDLPEKYAHLTHDPGVGEMSLADVMDEFGGSTNSFVIKQGDSFLGFIGFTVSDDGDTVTNVKLLDFNFEGLSGGVWQSNVIFEDVLQFMSSKLRKEYKWVRWGGYEENKRAVFVYKVYAQRNGGVGPVASDEGLLFLVPGTVGSLSREDIFEAFGGQPGVDVEGVLHSFGGSQAVGSSVSEGYSEECVQQDNSEVWSLSSGYPDLQGRGKGFIKSRLVRFRGMSYVDNLIEEGKVPQMIHTPLSDPGMARYRYLLGEGWPFETSLYEYIKSSLKHGFECYFITDDVSGRITGCLLCHVDGKIISDLKWFSLWERHQGQNREDFKNFVTEEVANGYTVSWTAVKDNPIMSFYKDLVVSMRGSFSEDDTGSGLVSFTVGGAEMESGSQDSPVTSNGKADGIRRFNGSGHGSSHNLQHDSDIGTVDLHTSQRQERFVSPVGPGGVQEKAGAVRSGAGLEFKRLPGVRVRRVLSNKAMKTVHSGLVSGRYHQCESFPAHVHDCGVMLDEDIIDSATMRQLMEGNNNPQFYHRADHLAATEEQGEPEIMRAYANTVELRTRSEHYTKNRLWYRQWVLLKDFKVIARDKDISLEDAVEYSIENGDVNVRCSCPSFLYHGFSYMGDQLGYLYGLPREKRFPKIRNPTLQNSSCKHLHLALEYLLSHRGKVVNMFSQYYQELDNTPKKTMIAIPAKGVPEEREARGSGGESSESEESGGFDGGVGAAAVEPEVISEVSDSDSRRVYVDTRLAERGLPDDEQVEYAGEESDFSDEDEDEEDGLGDDGEGATELVVDGVSDDDVQELSDEIDRASTGGKDSFVHEWSFNSMRPRRGGKFDLFWW
jgi:hypothetical protein